MNMPRYLKQMNYAEQKMVVGALEVIGDVTGSGMKTIRKSIDSLSGNVASINTEINNYWSDIANDAVITPGEKKDLRKEINTIERTHAAILSAAEDEWLLLAEEIQSYRRKYDELYDYLFNKLKLFDDSSTNTEIPDTEYFEEVFNNYYVAEILAQNRLAAGLAAATVRTLSNLDQVGMDGEVAIYNGAFYEYSLNEHKWILIDTNAIYLGPVEEEPVNAVIGSFFLAINDGVKLVRRLCARVRENDNARTVIANGKKVLAAIRQLPAGTIHLKTSAGWIPVTNVNDWRYMVAMNDLLKYGYAIPEYVEEHIKSNSGKDYHGAILALEEPEIPTKGYRWADLEELKTYYYNGLQWEISKLKNKDYFCWGGAHNTQYKELSLKRGYVYKLNNNEWRELIPEVASEVEGVSRLNNQEEFMAALTDILKLNSSGPGYFTTVFASAFFGNNASIESLQTKTIELSGDDGLIKSKDYYTGTDKGFIQRSDGSFAFQGGEFKDISCKAGSFTAVEIAGDSIFKGSIISGPLLLSQDEPEGIVYKFEKGTEFYKIVNAIKTQLPYMNVNSFTTDKRTIRPGRTRIDVIFNLTGTYNSVNFNKIVYRPFSAVGTNDDIVCLLNSNNEEVFYISQFGYYELNNEFEVSAQTSEFITLKLIGIPDYKPSIKGMVWNNNGVLNIVE